MSERKKCFNNNWFYFWNRAQPDLITKSLSEYSGKPEEKIPTDEITRHKMAIEVGLIKDEYAPDAWSFGWSKAIEAARFAKPEPKPNPIKLGFPPKLSDAL